MARMTLEQIKASRPRADRAKIEATREEDIARHMREDGENPTQLSEHSSRMCRPLGSASRSA